MFTRQNQKKEPTRDCDRDCNNGGKPPKTDPNGKRLLLTVVPILIVAVIAGVSLARNGDRSAAAPPTTPAAVSAGVASEYKTVVYYFHGNMRCFTCTNMEKYTIQAIRENFKDTSKVVMSVVNVDVPENKHFIDAYKLYTRSVVLSRVNIKDGKEASYKNLDRIWSLARNEAAFKEYIVSETNAFARE